MVTTYNMTLKPMYHHHSARSISGPKPVNITAMSAGK